MASSFNKNCLDDKIALITGGGSGICYEIANTFLKYGATVYILSRNKEKLLRAEMELNKGLSSQRCFSIPADVRKFDQINDAVDIILKKSGKLDILINGAAGLIYR
uniref:2,4-dienoyl-CoA reductase [(3E)-enoyl-CoA-producing] n=1 Tax=Nephromyces sp. MMRI TaxID=2496275 RepID=A0A3Q8UBX5_9APIC|nr:2,4-dienoyl-CoA reductase 2 [Nephromyces sp. MMRI]AZL94568.1 2,4-dienoyl-CoA reductase 2 [Nephromyces sp. MMRI]